MVKSWVESHRHRPRIVAVWTIQPRQGRHTMKVQTYRVRIAKARRVVLSSEVCRSMSLRIGDTLIVRVEFDRTTLSSAERTVERFQSTLAERVPAGYSAMDELIAGRESEQLCQCKA